MVTALKNAGIDTKLAYEAKFISKKIMGITRNAEKVNSKSDFNENLVKKDAKQITIENTIGPNQDVLKITYRKGMTAGDILIELNMVNDYLLADAEGEVSLEDIIPPSAELLLIPGSIAGVGSSESQTRGPNRRTRDDISSEILNDLKALTGKTQAQLKNIESKYYEEALKIFEKNPKLRKLLERNIKDNLFDTLMEYYIENELKYQEWVEFLQAEGNERFMSRYKNKYPRMKFAQVKWDSRVKIVQRLCWAILFDCRHPLSGQQLTLREWLSADLHHWDTTLGHENKYACRIIDLIPLLRKSMGTTLGHASITQLIKSGEDIEWENTFRDIISSVLSGQVPEIWMSRLDIIAYNKYLKSNSETLNLVLMFVTQLDQNFVKELGFNNIKFNF